MVINNSYVDGFDRWDPHAKSFHNPHDFSTAERRNAQMVWNKELNKFE